MNKKADIPVTILVLGVFAICVLAIFSFIYSEKKISENFVGIGLIETINSIEEEIRFDESMNGGKKFSNEIFYNFENIEIAANKKTIKGKYTDKNGNELISVEYLLP